MREIKGKRRNGKGEGKRERGREEMSEREWIILCALLMIWFRTCFACFPPPPPTDPNPTAIMLPSGLYPQHLIRRKRWRDDVRRGDLRSALKELIIKFKM
jgi:hypothetical protein